MKISEERSGRNMNILKEIRHWKSIRRFSGQKIEKEKILCILEAGRLAPSWQNLQPWHFLIIEEEWGKKEISKIVVTKKIVEKAPVLIVVFADKTGFDVQKAKRMIKEQVAEKMTEEQIALYLDNKIASPGLHSDAVLHSRLLEQIAYSCAFMILEVRHQGLGVCILGGIENFLTEKTENYEIVKKSLNIPDNLEPLTILCIGYEGEEVKNVAGKVWAK